MLFRQWPCAQQWEGICCCLAGLRSKLKGSSAKRFPQRLHPKTLETTQIGGGYIDSAGDFKPRAVGLRIVPTPSASRNEIVT